MTLLGAVYSHKVWEVELLTFEQINGYMDYARYVVAESTDFMRPPELLPPQNDLVQFALKVGVDIPERILFQMGFDEV